jgi:hypothetical protein
MALSRAFLYQAPFAARLKVRSLASPDVIARA